MHGQIEHIQGFSRYDRLFHSCVVNQFSLVSVNKKFHLGNYFEEHKSLFFQLNKACYNLYAFCNICLNDPSLQNLNTAEVERATEAAGQWKQLITNGSAFLTYCYAELVIDVLEKSGYGFKQKLYSDKYKGVPLLFTNIPAPLKTFLRIDFFIPEQGKYDLLAALIELLEKAPELFHCVECIEAAIDDPALIDVPAHPGAAPSLSLFLDKNLVQTHTLGVVSHLLEAIAGISRDCIIPEGIEFSHSIGNVVLSQGRRNYKKFLRLLSLLDNVYDPRFNYAFIRPAGTIIA